MVEPVRQRRVDISDLAGPVDREETAGRMIEIFDGVLQFLEHVLLALAVPRDVGDRPHRVLGLAFAAAERPHPHAQPAAVAAVLPRDADFFLLALAFARGFQEAEHRLGDVGIADEDAFYRADVLWAGSA